jgi:hypothetical protein
MVGRRLSSLARGRDDLLVLPLDNGKHLRGLGRLDAGVRGGSYRDMGCNLPVVAPSSFGAGGVLVPS